MGNHSTIPKRFNKKKAQQKQTTNPPDKPTIRSQKTARTLEGVPQKSARKLNQRPDRHGTNKEKRHHFPRPKLVRGIQKNDKNRQQKRVTHELKKHSKPNTFFYRWCTYNGLVFLLPGDQL